MRRLLATLLLVLPLAVAAQQIFINDNGTLREITEVYINDGGTLRQIEEVKINDNGTLRTVYQSAAPTLSGTLSTPNTNVAFAACDAGINCFARLELRADGTLYGTSGTPTLFSQRFAGVEWYTGNPTTVPVTYYVKFTVAFDPDTMAFGGVALGACVDLTATRQIAARRTPAAGSGEEKSTIQVEIFTDVNCTNQVAEGFYELASENLF